MDLEIHMLIGSERRCTTPMRLKCVGACIKHSAFNLKQAPLGICRDDKVSGCIGMNLKAAISVWGYVLLYLQEASKRILNIDTWVGQDFPLTQLLLSRKTV